MSFTQWELHIALETLGLDPAEEQIVTNAMPVASKLLGHVEDNKQLFSTLWADIQLVLPAAKILLKAFNENKSLKLTIERSNPDG